LPAFRETSLPIAHAHRGIVHLCRLSVVICYHDCRHWHLVCVAAIKAPTTHSAHRPFQPVEESLQVYLPPQLRDLAKRQTSSLRVKWGTGRKRRLCTAIKRTIRHTSTRATVPGRATLLALLEMAVCQ
jgi:hypothetical protein